jgi:hypothetical protein
LIIVVSVVPIDQLLNKEFLVPAFTPPSKLITPDYFRYKNVWDTALIVKFVGYSEHLEKNHFIFLSHTIEIMIATSQICFKAYESM